MFLFCLNRTVKAMPALTQSPATQEPKLATPSINNSVISTLEAQLGISPTSPNINGWKIESVSKTFFRFSIPTHASKPPITIFIMKINKHIFKQHGL